MDLETIHHNVTALTDALVETEVRRREDFNVLVTHLVEQATRLDLVLEQFEGTREALVTIAAAISQYQTQERLDAEKGRPVILVVDPKHRDGH